MRTLARRKLLELLQRDDDPMSVAIAIANDERQDVGVRLQAVQTVLPYIYPKLSAQITADATEQLKRAEPADLVRMLNERIGRIGSRPHIIEGVAAPIKMGAE